MFNLDQAIADWRRKMVAGGIKSPDVLDELECHLRDEIERQIHSGAHEQHAYRAAVASIGPGQRAQSRIRQSRKGRPPTAADIPPNFLFRLSRVRALGQHLDSSGI